MLSPRRNVVDEGVPSAERETDKVPAVVIGPPVTLTNCEPAPLTDVTVPVPLDASTNATRLCMVKPTV